MLTTAYTTLVVAAAALAAAHLLVPTLLCALGFVVIYFGVSLHEAPKVF